MKGNLATVIVVNPGGVAAKELHGPFNMQAVLQDGRNWRQELGEKNPWSCFTGLFFSGEVGLLEWFCKEGGCYSVLSDVVET